MSSGAPSPSSFFPPIAGGWSQSHMYIILMLANLCVCAREIVSADIGD